MRPAISELSVIVAVPELHVALARAARNSALMFWPAALSEKSATTASALLLFPSATTVACSTSAVSAPPVGSGKPLIG